MTPGAKLISVAMGTGYKLCIPHDGSPASLLYSETREMAKTAKQKRWQKTPKVDPIDLSQFDGFVVEMLSSGKLLPLTRNRNGSRLGWSEFEGLNGLVADYYVFVQ